MPLPTIETPVYELKLPSTNKKIKYRPFLVKEEKVLIIALESKNQIDITTDRDWETGVSIVGNGIIYYSVFYLVDSSTPSISLYFEV